MTYNLLNSIYNIQRPLHRFKTLKYNVQIIEKNEEKMYCY